MKVIEGTARNMGVSIIFVSLIVMVGLIVYKVI